MTRQGLAARDPVTPLWWGTIALRWITLAFAGWAAAVHSPGYARPWLAWSVFAAMFVWTMLTTFVYATESGRRGWLVVVDTLLTCALMMTSPLILSPAQYAAVAPLSTTVWAAVPPLAAGAKFGAKGGVIGGIAVAGTTVAARMTIDLDVSRDCLLLIASGLLVGVAATMARGSAAALAHAMRAEAAIAERERLARSIHDSVLQVLARVRRRGNELGGEAAELARLAGEQEISLRSLVSSGPAATNGNHTTDLRAALQLLASPTVAISAPAGEVPLPAETVTELLGVVTEALSNTETHAGTDASSWVLLEDLGDEVVLSIRDDGPGIPPGRLADAEAQGHLGVAQSIKGRVTDLAGTITLDTGAGAGTEWEIRVPRDGESRR